MRARPSPRPGSAQAPPTLTAVSDACVLSWNIPRTFSSCSGNNYEKFLLNRSPACLLDKPDYHSLQAPAVCGNGFQEQGEQCDCGTVQVNTHVAEAGWGGVAVGGVKEIFNKIGIL